MCIYYRNLEIFSLFVVFFQLNYIILDCYLKLVRKNIFFIELVIVKKFRLSLLKVLEKINIKIKIC